MRKRNPCVSSGPINGEPLMDAAAEDFPASNQPRRFLPLRAMSYLLPVFVLAAAAAVSYYLWEKERRNIEQVMQADFDTRVREAVGIFRERMLAVEQVLYAINGLFASSSHVERGEFQAFVANLRIDSHPGLQGVGYSVLVPAAEKDRHVAALRGGGFPRYAIRPEGKREVYSSAIYFEPSAAAYLSTLGSDYLAEPSRRFAMETARDTHGVAISNKIKLPEEDAKQIQDGFRMVLPVYRNGTSDKTLAQRRANLAGWIFASFSMDGLLENILGERANIALDVHDGGDALVDEQLIDTSSDRVGGESTVKLFYASKRVEVGGYAWTITARSLPNFTTPIAISKLQLIASVGGGRQRHAGVAHLVLAAKTHSQSPRRGRTAHRQGTRRGGQSREIAISRRRQPRSSPAHACAQPVHCGAAFHGQTTASPRRGGGRDRRAPAIGAGWAWPPVKRLARCLASRSGGSGGQQISSRAAGSAERTQ